MTARIRNAEASTAMERNIFSMPFKPFSTSNCVAGHSKSFSVTLNIYHHHISRQTCSWKISYDIVLRKSKVDEGDFLAVLKKAAECDVGQR